MLQRQHLSVLADNITTAAVGGDLELRPPLPVNYTPGYC